jgi:hypothetical protein
MSDTQTDSVNTDQTIENVSLNDKINILKKYLNTLKNILYVPFFYKIAAMKPVDIYELILSVDTNHRINIPPFIVASESFDVLLNFLFIDINVLYEFLYISESGTKVTNIVSILKENDFKKKILNDTEKIYSNSQNIHGLINIINNNKDNQLVNELFDVYPHYNIEKNNYYKETKFISIVNFINMLKILLNKKYYSKDEIVNILLYILNKNKKNIKDCIDINNNLNNVYEDKKMILNKLDDLLNEYSSDTVLTFIKFRSDYNDDYNKRFYYKLYGKKLNQKKYKFEDNGNIVDYIKEVEKKMILKLNYNDDDITYYEKEKEGSRMIPSKEGQKKVTSYYQETNVTDNNYILNEDKYRYRYIFGPLSEIFDYNYSNKEISDKLDVVVNCLIKQKPVLIIGYGASGAGKTSTLIYFNKGTNPDSKNGILVHLCNRMAIEHKFNKIKLKCREFFVETKQNTPNIRYFPSKKEDHIEFIYEDNTFKLNTFNSTDSTTYIYENKYTEKTYPETQTIFNKDSTLGELIIHLIDNDRFVAATTNNPNSSRSHCLIFVTMLKIIKDKDNKEKEYETTLILGDFAGVENLFNCDSDEFKKKFLEVKRDDIFLDDEKIKKITNKISELGSQNDSKNEKEINELNNILSSFKNDKNEKYYYKYPIMPYYKKLFETRSEFELNQKKIIEKFVNNNSIPQDKYPNFNFEYNNKGIIDKQKYKHNTILYIEDIIKNNLKEDEIYDLLINVLNNLKILDQEKNNEKKKIIIKKIYDSGDIYVLLIKCIFGINYDIKDNINSIDNIFDIKVGSNDIVKYIGTLFGTDNDGNMYKLPIRYIKYFVNIFNQTMKNSIKNFKIENELNYGKEVCSVRRTEGVFINSTLLDIRDLINYIIIEKNKYKLTLSPPFVNECLNFYCTKESCFELKNNEMYDTYNKRLSDINNIEINIKNNLPFKSIIFNTIIDELGIKVKDVIISVFCVFNISKGANNPPPVPYISINKLKYYYYNKKFNEFKKEISKFYFDPTKNNTNTSETKFDNDCILSNYNNEKIKNIIDSSDFKNIMAIMKNIKNFENEEFNKIIIKFFNLIDNFNAASAIGTLEFVDSLSKYNTISNICDMKNFKNIQVENFNKTY